MKLINTPFTKKTFTTLLASITLGLFFTNCTPEAVSVEDSEAQDFMHQTSFDVTSYEFYDFSTDENYEKTDDYDNVHFTVNGDQAFLTKIILAPRQEGQPSVTWETYDVEFLGGGVARNLVG